MTDINRQKFLAELSKLLTFMYEEDLRAALAMYNRLFDEAEDEQALLRFLMSPTRQAVMLARAYNAKERKLQVHAQVRHEDTDSDELPEFILTIERIRDEALDRGIVSSPIPESQMSLFDGGEDIIAWQATGFLDEPTHAAAESRPAQAAPVKAPAPAEEAAPVPAAVSPEESAADHAADFLDSFSGGDDGQTWEEPASEAEPVPAPPVLQQAAVPMQEPVPKADAYGGDAPTVRKTRVGLLILFIIFAVPLGIAGIGLLLIPTLFFLALAVIIIALGVAAVSSAFGGFAVFADILVMLGASVAILALGLLVLWMFVWFLGGAIPALIRGLILLGKKWCTKEVAA